MSDTRFEELGHEIVQRAEQVKVPFTDFIGGLESIIEIVSERLTLAKSEYRTMAAGED